MISISPCQKPGKLNPKMEPVTIQLSTRLAGFSPAHKPSGIPSATAISSAQKASSKVAGMREKIKSMEAML